MEALQSRALAAGIDVRAPDGSEIRLLVSSAEASMVHCTLPAGATSLAIRHREVEELWYVLEGQGEIWRALDDAEEVLEARPGQSLTIPPGAHFQFRNPGTAPLRILIVTLPPWPGEDEAVRVPGHWPEE